MEVEIVGWIVDVRLTGGLQEQPFELILDQVLRSIFFRQVVRVVGVGLLDKPYHWHCKPNRERLNIRLFFLLKNPLSLVEQ